jgi:hypothetical protein
LPNIAAPSAENLSTRVTTDGALRVYLFAISIAPVEKQKARGDRSTRA